MRIGHLARDNRRMQGPERRTWYRAHAPRHLAAVEELVDAALHARDRDAPDRAVVLGAGACTEFPLERLARSCGAVVLADVDVRGMTQARDGLPASLRERVDLVQGDIAGGISDLLTDELKGQPWRDLAQLDPKTMRAVLDAAAGCLERCPVPDPPLVPYLTPGLYGLVVSDLVLTQLYSLPLLDLLDALAARAPEAVDLREAHPRYVAAAADFRRRVALAHVSLLRSLVAPGGVALLLTDVTGYLIPEKSGAHAKDPAEAFPVLPPEALRIPDDLAARFEVIGRPRTWRWPVSLPGADVPGREYDATGVLLRAPSGGYLG